MVLSRVDPALARFADLDGDGFDELISLHTDGTTSAWWNNHTFPDQPWHASVVVGKDWDDDPARYHFANLTSEEYAH